MQRLRGMDSAFLDEELPAVPLNPVVLAILRPPVGDDGAPQPVTMAYLHEHVAARLGELPSFRWRVQPVPLGLHHPVYLEDPDFRLGNHLHHTTLTGDLDRLVADLAAQHLDRSRPLWQLTLVDGLPDGRQALVLTYQHCLADGTAAVTTYERLFSGLDHVVAAPPEPWTPEPIPTPGRLLRDALADYARSLPRLASLIARTVRAVLAVRAHRQRAAVKALQPFRSTPDSSFNISLVGQRVYSHASLSLADVKAVKDAAGVSLNDVVLAVVAGATRRYLGARDELPERSMNATVPMAFEPPGAPKRQHGNWFTGVTTTLATDVDDPWQRLRAIAASMDAAKTEIELAGPELMPAWADYFPPFLHQATTRQFDRRRRRNPTQPDMVNVVVSNLRGPATRWSFGPARIEEMYVTGPPNLGIGVNVLVWSYADRLAFGILSFADSMRDPQALEGHLQASLAELVVAAERHRMP